MPRAFRIMTYVGPAALFLVLLACPSHAAAQKAERLAADAPSRNRETIVQHDSLAVHFLRSPKAKPAARAATGTAAPSALKFRGRREPSESAAPVATPLPTKQRATKR